MSAVTGPISTLAGTSHDFPDGTMCDEHPDRPAVARIQGETDSFGCEMDDLCQECIDARKAYRCSPEGIAEDLEWRTGQCEWCKNHATDLRDARDYDEGMNGRVYRVCGACIKRVNDEAQVELDAMGYDDYDDYDDFDDEDDFGVECGRWDNGVLTQHCAKAGTEECDWDCPYSRDSAEEGGEA